MVVVKTSMVEQKKHIYLNLFKYASCIHINSIDMRQSYNMQYAADIDIVYFYKYSVIQIPLVSTPVVQQVPANSANSRYLS